MTVCRESVARHGLIALGCVLWMGVISAPAQSLERAASLENLEGPASDNDGNVYFTEGNFSDRILKLAADGSVSTFRHPANRPNGLVFDSQFRLIAAERGDPATKTPGRITRTDLKTGKIEVVADAYEGKPFGSPNDVTFDGRGRIYFSAGGAVYRIDTDRKLSRLVAPPEVQGSNGLMISPDDRIFYLVEQNTAANGARRIRAFDLASDGSISNPRIFHDFYPGRGGDGMAIDVEGNLYVAAGLNRPRGTSETLDVKAGIHVFSPAGVVLQFIPVPEDNLTNVAFGGSDLKTLYITAGHSLFKVPTKIAGTRR